MDSPSETIVTNFGENASQEIQQAASKKKRFMTTEELTFCHLLTVIDIFQLKKGKIKLFIAQPLHPMLCRCSSYL